MLRELRKERPTIKLLYVTPEQLVKGTRLQALLAGLHARGRLARFVIDEVCTKLWWPANRLLSMQTLVTDAVGALPWLMMLRQQMTVGM